MKKSLLLFLCLTQRSLAWKWFTGEREKMTFGNQLRKSLTHSRGLKKTRDQVSRIEWEFEQDDAFLAYATAGEFECRLTN